MRTGSIGFTLRPMKTNLLSLGFSALITVSYPVFADEATSEKATEVSAAAQKITLECNDQMQFNKKELKIKAGEAVELTLVHTGKMLKEVMGHNFVLLEKGTDLTAWATKAMAARDTDFIPQGDDDKKAVLVHTKVLGGGEKETITFTVKEAGEYEFLCSFPGHFAIMRGKVFVE